MRGNRSVVMREREAPPTLDELRFMHDAILKAASHHHVANVRMFGSVAPGKSDDAERRRLPRGRWPRVRRVDVVSIRGPAPDAQDMAAEIEGDALPLWAPMLTPGVSCTSVSPIRRLKNERAWAARQFLMIRSSATRCSGASSRWQVQLTSCQEFVLEFNGQDPQQSDSKRLFFEYFRPDVSAVP